MSEDKFSSDDISHVVDLRKWRLNENNIKECLTPTNNHFSRSLALSLESLDLDLIKNKIESQIIDVLIQVYCHGRKSSLENSTSIYNCLKIFPVLYNSIEKLWRLKTILCVISSWNVKTIELRLIIIWRRRHRYRSSCFSLLIDLIHRSSIDTIKCTRQRTIGSILWENEDEEKSFALLTDEEKINSTKKFFFYIDVDWRKWSTSVRIDWKWMIREKQVSRGSLFSLLK